ncbi:M55 family metallopeptidase [candidate division KSB1 bacterium]
MQIKKSTIMLSIFILAAAVLLNHFTGCSQNPQSLKGKGLRVYIHADMDGASGVVTFEKHALPPGALYEQSKILNTMEVNAAIEALLEEGVSEIVVLDDHGPGGINIDYLNPAAELIMGHGEPVTIDNSFDFQLILGKHAMPNTPNANLAHAFSLKINNIWLNGKLAGEISDTVLLASYFNVPTIFLAGCQEACNEITDLIPKIETVAVKKGLGMRAAWCLSPEKARKEIKAGVKRAMKRMKEIEIYRVEPPYKFIIEHTDAERTEYQSKRYGWKRISDTKCTYTINDYIRRKF